MKNNHYKQSVRPDGIVFLLVLLLSGGILLKPLLSAPQDEMRVQARTRAESLGYQLLQMQADSRRNLKSSRGPASTDMAAADLGLRAEGVIGTDPWGSPYNYRVVQVAPGQSQVIEVWSQNLTERVQVSAASSNH